MLQFEATDFFLIAIGLLLVGHLFSSAFNKYLEANNRATTKSAKPVKQITPEVIHRRIVKAQWRFIKKRMYNLVTEKGPKPTGLSSMSSMKVVRNCVGVIFLGSEERTSHARDSSLYKAIPLCEENKEKLMEMGFKDFSDDGLWVSYVEPL